MKIHSAFPTLIYQGSIPPSQSRKLNRELIKETEVLTEIDEAGATWSRKNYANGYSSYSSMTQLHHTSPHFGELAKLLKPHVSKYIHII